ncbi:carbamoyltransferase C-terminal domain-containing protein [Actinokineospora enzanensis]|uniref:carbamoyltransferase C-terminal domain-containing protein n=1 Tax=Actinokineospora enzanensis TaxID=155975 RepID=UPI0003611628|nr:carbamoyltransferase C-terminal domain-containing protein [Actinokineospora enzanensis]
MSTSDLICGLKLTHDGGVAVVADGELLFSTEAEKLANRDRHAPMNVATDLAARLADHDLAPADLAAVAVDGWARGAEGETWVEVFDDAGTANPVEVALYHDEPGATGMLDGVTGTSPLFGTANTGFRSFTHATGHVFASYCTSPFARAGKRALVIVWDGGMPPCLYVFDPGTRHLECLGPVGPISGALFPIFSSHFDAFRVNHSDRMSKNAGPGLEALLPIAGKAMAYAALDEVSEDAIVAMRHATDAVRLVDGAIPAYLWTRKVLTATDGLGLSDPTLIGSLQQYLFRALLEGIKDMFARRPDLAGLPLCMSGGCALNIKWNSGLRASGLFEDVWVPPFPNDSGSAIGSATAEMVRLTGNSALEWSVFAGPDVVETGHPPAGWTARACDIDELAKLLEVRGEPVVVVSGRAELGPRALGHRSIIAPAVSEGMKDRLNEIKNRESYRPVAPICLEHRAPEVFDPGTPDPYMLFDHMVRPEWRDKVPAIVHLDGTARLQTVGPDNDLMFRLLTAYERSTGVPVLCNTSANFKGSGFFPDAESAMRWGCTAHVWSNGTLYSNEP